VAASSAVGVLWCRP